MSRAWTDGIKGEVYAILSARQLDSLVAKIETGGHFGAFCEQWIDLDLFGKIDGKASLRLNAFFSTSEKEIVIGAITDLFAHNPVRAAALQVGKRILAREVKHPSLVKEPETIESDVYDLLSARQFDSLRRKIETGGHFKALTKEFLTKSDQDFLRQHSTKEDYEITRQVRLDYLLEGGECKELTAFSEEEMAIVFSAFSQAIRLNHKGCAVIEAERNKQKRMQEEKKKEEKEKEDEDEDDFDYEDSCDCCVKGWSKANEFGRCVCRCSRCRKLLRNCRYKCFEEAAKDAQPSKKSIIELREREKKEEKEKKRKKQEVADAQAAVRAAETTAKQQAHREETDQLAKQRQQEIEAGRKALSEAKQAEKKADEAQRLADDKAKLEAEKEKKQQDTQEKKRLKQLECLSPAQKRRLGAADDDDAEEKPPKKGKKK
jgi:hypothetical protein